MVKRKIANNSDEDLLVLYTLTNCSDYIRELYNRYVPLVYGLCLKHFRDAEKAGEVVVELFEMLLSEVPVHEIKVFKTWIYDFTNDYCSQMLQEDEKEEEDDEVDEVEEEEEQHFNADAVEANFVLYLLEANGSKEEMKVLKHCLEKLPKPQKNTISMFFMEKMSYADIAEQTGYLLNTIKSHIQNGQISLKNSIEQYRNK